MIIKINGLCKSFHGLSVLENIDLHLDEGKFYAILGRNGSGKSTLMNILMRMELPNKGQIEIFGEDYYRDTDQFNGQIGFVSENIVYGGGQTLKRFFSGYEEIYPKWDEQLFVKLLDVQKISLDKKFKELSRGQRMQVALAVSLAIRPKILLLDEITSVLDAGARSFFLKYLGEFKANGGTILMATNIVSEVQFYAEHLILLEDKNIRLNAPIHDLASRFIKLRRKFDDNRTIFQDPDCVDVSMNSDNSVSFIIPHENRELFEFNGIMPDRRNITIEEIFIYYTAKKELL